MQETRTSPGGDGCSSERVDLETGLTETPPIDRAHLALYTMGDSVLEREILKLFADQLPEMLEQLRGAVTVGDWRVATHTLKGSARAVGAWALAECVSAAEAASDETAEWPQHVDAIRHQGDVAARFIAALSHD